jgi:ComF family protein
MCLAAKRPRSEELAAALGGSLWQLEEKALREAGAEIVIPVPHHWSENWRRTPHAPETLAAVLSRRLRAQLATHILAKSRRTDKQSDLPPTRRRTNLKGAFHVRRRYHSALKGRRILLVDDVLTTGATANAAARALREAKASFIAVAVVARALGKKPMVNRIG